MLIAALIAPFLSACAPNTVSGTATGSQTEAASSTLAMTPVQPTTAYDDIPLEENPFLWATSTPYTGSFDVKGLALDLMNPVPEVQDRIEAVANLGSRCTVVVMKSMGVPPKTFGVALYDNPKDLGSFDHMGGVDAEQAESSVIGPHRDSCN